MSSSQGFSFSHILRTLPFLRPKKSMLQRRVNHLRKFISYAAEDLSTPAHDVDYSRLHMTWVIPDFKPGAGGHMTIFRIVRYLEEFGHKVDFLIQNPTEHETGEEAHESINDHFQPFNGKVTLFKETFPEVTGDALIATDRFTCYPVNAMNGFTRKFYFVQDFEPSFYPMGSEYLLAEATYHLDFDCLCAGDWLHKIMSERYGRWSMSWPLAYDHAVYNSSPDIPRIENRIAVYARYATPRRAVELIYLALDILQQRGVDFEVAFFGQNLGKLDVEYPHSDHGLLNAEGLADLYRRAAIGVVFSATNHSLVNKEMMACGLPVLDLDLENVRAVFPNECMAFATPTPDGIADQLQTLLEHQQERQRLHHAGLKYVQPFSWENSARLIEKALRTRVNYALTGGGHGEA